MGNTQSLSSDIGESPPRSSNQPRSETRPRHLRKSVSFITKRKYSPPNSPTSEFRKTSFEIDSDPNLGASASSSVVQISDTVDPQVKESSPKTKSSRSPRPAELKRGLSQKTTSLSSTRNKQSSKKKPSNIDSQDDISLNKSNSRVTPRSKSKKSKSGEDPQFLQQHELSDSKKRVVSDEYTSTTSSDYPSFSQSSFRMAEYDDGTDMEYSRDGGAGEHSTPSSYSPTIAKLASSKNSGGQRVKVPRSASLPPLNLGSVSSQQQLQQQLRQQNTGLIQDLSSQSTARTTSTSTSSTTNTSSIIVQSSAQTPKPKRSLSSSLSSFSKQQQQYNLESGSGSSRNSLQIDSDEKPPSSELTTPIKKQSKSKFLKKASSSAAMGKKNSSSSSQNSARSSTTSSSASNSSIHNVHQNPSQPKTLTPISEETWEALGQDISKTLKPSTAEDFELLRVIGRVSLAKLLQVRCKLDGKVYAMKVMKKVALLIKRQVQQAREEKSILQRINHPYIVKLHYAFQSTDKLFLILAFINGGELFLHLRREERFDEIRAKFYAAEIALALKHLHGKGIVYRNLKPENIMLDKDGHIVISDFGISCSVEEAFSNQNNSNLNNSESGSNNNDQQQQPSLTARGPASLVGTPEYMSPEVICGYSHGYAADWWSLGILLYEMLTGLTPFYSKNVQVLFQKILYAPLEFPDYVSPVARDLITSLLQREPSDRLTTVGILSHPFFEGIDWRKLRRRQMPAPWLPTVSSDPADVSQFDPDFLKENPHSYNSQESITPLSSKGRSPTNSSLQQHHHISSSSSKSGQRQPNSSTSKTTPTKKSTTNSRTTSDLASEILAENSSIMFDGYSFSGSGPSRCRIGTPSTPSMSISPPLISLPH